MATKFLAAGAGAARRILPYPDRNLVCRSMKRILSLILLVLVGSVRGEDADPFDEMFSEALKLNSELVEALNEDDYQGKFADEQMAGDKANYAATEELIKFAQRSDDPALKVRVLKVEFGWALTDCYWDLEEAAGKLEEMAIKARLAKYKRYLKKLDELAK